MCVSAVHSQEKEPVVSDEKRAVDIATCKDLPTLPHVAMQIIEATLQDNTSLRELADVVALDPALSAKVLRTVNSAFFGFPNEVTTLPHAMSILGIRAVRNLSLGLLIVREFSHREGGLTRLASRQLWKRALSGAVIAKQVGQYTAPQLADEAFLVALLQDIGTMALMAVAPEEYRAILRKNIAHGPELCEAERAVFKTDHMEAGRILAKKWNLPEAYQTCLGSHHRRVEDVSADTANHVLDRLVRFSAAAACLATSNVDPVEVLYLQEIAIKHFSLSRDQIGHILDHAHTHAVELGSIFDVPMGGIRKYTDLLEQATQKLSEIGVSYEEALARARQEKARSQQAIRELEEAKRQLEEMAARDELTGLFNKRAFTEALSLAVKRSIRYKRPLALLMVDIDNFKRVNDTYGHQTGDQVLKDIALAMRQVLRETDLLARYGGEEFVIVLDEASPGETQVLAERVRSAIDHRRFAAGKDRLHVTVSVGGTSVEPGSPDVLEQKLIGCADKALYAAKRAGRNRTSYLDASA